MTELSADPRLAGIVRTMRWRVRPERLVLVGIDPREQPVALRLAGGLSGRFWQLIVEPEVVTLALDDTDWRQISPAFPRAEVERGFRAISFEVDLALLSGALAGAGVPLLAVCGYNRDHLLVREQHLERAEAAIAALIARA
jgi:uncharacterized protein